MSESEKSIRSDVAIILSLSRRQNNLSDFYIPCQNKNCKNETVVYLRDLSMINEYYVFICPKCKSKTSFKDSFALVNDFIPENAVEAKLAD